MLTPSQRNLVFDSIEEISRLTSVPDVGRALADLAETFAFRAFGINGLPPPDEAADPLIWTEQAPDGFRGTYIEERFYLVDSFCAYARRTGEPFRFSEAPYDRREQRGHERFMQALRSFGMGEGLMIQVGRSAALPTSVWFSGESPQLDTNSILAVQLISLFAASKAHALSHTSVMPPVSAGLTPREREVLQWIAAGKTSWEIGVIVGISERAVNTIIGAAMTKLEAVSRAQAVINAIRIGEIEF